MPTLWFALIFWRFDARPLPILFATHGIGNQFSIAVIPAFGFTADMQASRGRFAFATEGPFQKFGNAGIVPAFGASPDQSAFGQARAFAHASTPRHLFAIRAGIEFLFFWPAPFGGR